MGYEKINDNIVENLTRLIGKTVTVITVSGGKGGLGFTGIVVKVNRSFIRLVTRILPPRSPFPDTPHKIAYRRLKYKGYYFDGNFIVNVNGAIVDIPVDKITSFIHNAD